MANQNNRDVTVSQQTRAYAAYYGLWAGLCWIGSFALSMIGLQTPLAGNLGLLLGLLSIYFVVRLMRGFRENIAPLPLRRAWYMAWMIFAAAALLCTAAQYIYFAYIDGGLLMRTYSELMQQPEVMTAMQQMLPEENVEELMNQAFAAFAATPPSQLALQFLFWNLILATIFAIPTALLAYKGQSKNQ